MVSNITTNLYLMCQYLKFIMYDSSVTLFLYPIFVCRLYALKKIELDENRKTRTKEAVSREARSVRWRSLWGNHLFTLLCVGNFTGRKTKA